MVIASPAPRTIDLQKDDLGYWHAEVGDVAPGSLYRYRLDDSIEKPDPASNFQPAGVHGPSQVVDHSAFKWSDSRWRPPPLESLVIYELHVGTFTPEGTFDAVIPRLEDLRALGITAIELMPVAQYPGERNWGYDGVYPFAVQNSYGGPEGLKRMVDACHQAGLAVILDVVYNHLGPEGNYLAVYGPYFTEAYQTPWGRAVNFDGEFSYAVREFFIQNALNWVGNYHVDGLRLDAVHAIVDMSARHFLEELGERVAGFSRESGRIAYLIAESDLNDVRLVRSGDQGGYSLDAQWCDDFHHSLRALLTGEKSGYYADFGEVEHLAKSYREGFVYSWQYSRYRKRFHGSSSKDIPGKRLVVFSQNHDQVGNRMLGERLSQLASFEALKLAAAAVLVAPYIPLLFMGEEYGEEAPFLYFVSHSDEGLIEAVREGRKNEFKAFGWQREPPDPQSEDTFLRSKLRWEERAEGNHRVLLEFYQTMLRLRAANPALLNLEKKYLTVGSPAPRLLTMMRRWENGQHVFSIMNFSEGVSAFSADLPSGSWTKMIDSADEAWSGPGSLLPSSIESGFELTAGPFAFAMYERSE